MLDRNGPKLEELRRTGGLYHLSAGGRTSWCGFARAIFDEAAIACRVNAISSADFPTAARRPANSLMDNGRLLDRFGLSLPEWRHGLRLCIEDLRACGEVP